MGDTSTLEVDAQDPPTAPAEDQDNRDEDNCYAKVPWALLVIPSDSLDKERFAVAFSGTVRDAWVKVHSFDLFFTKQTSPACAAASVASALNLLLQLERGAESAFTQETILKFYKALVAEKVQSLSAKLCRLTGVTVEELQGFLSVHLKNMTAFTSKKLVCEVKEALKRLPNDNKLCLLKGASSKDRQIDAGDAAGEAEPPVNKKFNEVQQLLFDLVKQMRGLAKLSLPRPSTGHIGNVALKQVVARVSSTLPQHFPGLKAETLMSRGKALNKVNPGDSEEEIRRQWKELWAAYVNPNVALIMHLKNHYALIYALREWTSSKSNIRQVLSARKGQTPRVWIDFEEYRRLMLRWNGYGILMITAIRQSGMDSAI